MNRSDVLLLTLLLAPPALGTESKVLRELMGESVYERSGVRELSAEQISVLEQWVQEHAAGASHPDEPAVPEVGERRVAPEKPATPEDEKSQAAPGIADAAPAPPPRDSEPEVIRSQIDGHFDGWRDNGTRFPLQNGQIWEQRQPATFITDLESPAVIIRRNRFGYTMEVPAIGRKVHVKRIR